MADISALRSAEASILAESHARARNHPPTCATHPMAAARLRACLLMLYAGGTLDATWVCALAWWISLCGIGGFKDIRYDPTSPYLTKNASHKLKTALGLFKREQHCYWAAIPACSPEGM